MSRNSTGTKQRIIEAGRTLYSIHGCDGTTLEDIITACGITKGAFYHYFKSKDSLCETMLEQVIADYQQLAESIDSGAEPIEQLRQMVRQLGQLNSSGKWVNCRLILRLSADCYESHPKIQHKIQEFWRWQTNFYEDLIQKCRNSGRLNTSQDTKTQARLLMSVMAGAITLEKITPAGTDLNTLAEAVIDSLGSQ